MQNRVNTALPRLPEDVRRVGVTAKKQSPTSRSPRSFQPGRLARYLVSRQLRHAPGPRPSRASTAWADANSLGGQDFTDAHLAQPEKLSALNLTAGDVTRFA